VRVVAAFTIDEEHTFLGVQRLAADLPAVDAAIVFEPTGLDIVDAHKGVARFAVETRGRACHSSRPQDGANAIERMAGVVARLTAHHAELARRQRPASRPADAQRRHDRRRRQPNTVPDRCRIELDRRLVPGESAEAARAEVLDLVGPTTWRSARSRSPARPDPAPRPGPAARHARRGDRRRSRLARGRGGALRDRRLDPGRGGPAVRRVRRDIAQAHTKDEWIAVNELEQAGAVLREFLRRWAGA
jgi:acetylornithine deacetylase